MTSPSSLGPPPSRRPPFSCRLSPDSRSLTSDLRPLTSVFRPPSLRSLTRLLLTLTLFSALALCIAWFAFPLDPARLQQIPQARRVLDRDGRLLRLETGTDGTLAIPVPLEQTSPWLAKAIIAAEDKRFETHPGIDPLAIARAVTQNASSGRVISGASTLSTQIMRMTRPQPRTLAVKAGEALHALQMESTLTKPEILAQYLNRAPFGGNLAGVEAACRAWFGKSAAEVSLAEAALLMGLPQSPGRLRPDRNPEGAAKRRDYVLERMEENGMISADQRAAASATPVAVSRSAPPFLAPHLCDLLLRRHPGAVVRSTLDPRLQAIAEHALRAHSEKLAPRGIHGGAVVIVDMVSSSVAALVGSPDYFDAQHAGQVNGATAKRAPGSTLKPFVYLEAFDRGLLTPDSIIADVPVRYAGYEPANFDHQFRGPVSVREALVASLNIPALKTLEQIGLDTGLTRLRAAGLQSLNRPASHYGISLALGSAEVTLLELAEAYAALARLGEHRPLRLCDTDPDGPAVRIASPGAAWMLADILSGAERALQASGHMADTLGPRYAWKTGTSMGHRDAWTVAYSTRYVVGVWIGNPSGATAQALTGIEVAAPLADRIFRQLDPRGETPWYPRPDALATRRVCTASGCAAGPHCPHTREAPALAGRTDPTPCSVHQLRPFARDDGRQLKPADAARVPCDWKVAEVWPPEVESWRTGTAAFQAAPALTSDLRPLTSAPRLPSPVSRPPTSATSLRILSPVRGVAYRYLPGDDSGRQRLELKAAASAGSELFWFVNGERVARVLSGESAWWPLAPGRHTIACADPTGLSRSIDIEVE